MTVYEIHADYAGQLAGPIDDIDDAREVAALFANSRGQPAYILPAGVDPMDAGSWGEIERIDP